MKSVLSICLLALIGSAAAFSPIAPRTTFEALAKPAVAGVSTAFFTAIASVSAEELEVAELPPPYVPIIFALGLLVGVGLLTGSLGDVLDEEASLGLQSGARAKKEIERSRSSYFKKK